MAPAPDSTVSSAPTGASAASIAPGPAKPSPAASLASARRVVVKIGSALLVDEDAHQIRQGWLDVLADDISVLHKRGMAVVVVSSGAIAAGREHLGLAGRPLRLEEKQAAAATGQLRLAHAYQEALARHGITVAQVLLTTDDTEDRRRHLNARSTLDTLLGLGAVPVINENDTVATTEIRFGDNDRLAARVAQMISADTLVLLSDIDGLYTADPKKDPTAQFVDWVPEITTDILNMAGAALPGYSSGGMVTKLVAAQIATGAGCRMAIAKGKVPGALGRLLMPGARATWFAADVEPSAARKRWIGGMIKTTGTITVDAGAVRALHSGKSLLPAGVRAVTGDFQRGDPVSILGPDRTPVAIGLSAYAAEDASKIIGLHSADLAPVLGYAGRAEMIHRDNLTML